MEHVEHRLATPQQRAFPISPGEARAHDGNLSFVQSPSVTFPGQTYSSSTHRHQRLPISGFAHGWKDALKPSTAALLLAEFPPPSLASLRAASHCPITN